MEVVRFLVEAGADKDVANDGGYTALMQAAESGHVEAVQLLEAGTDKDVADSCGSASLQASHTVIAPSLSETGRTDSSTSKRRRLR